MPEYKPKLKCTFSDCLGDICPIYDLVLGETIIGEVLGKGLDFKERTTKNTYSRTFDVDGTKVKVTIYGDTDPKNCGFRIRTNGPYGDKFLEELKKKVIQGIPKIEVKE